MIQNITDAFSSEAVRPATRASVLHAARRTDAPGAGSIRKIQGSDPGDAKRCLAEQSQLLT